MGMPTYIYEVEQGNRVYMVSYVDLPADLSGSDSTTNAGLEGAVSGSISTAGGTVQSKQDISIDGYPGKDVSASSPHGYMRVRYYLVDQRLYSVLAVSVGPSDASAEQFLASFRLGLDYSGAATPTTIPYHKVVTATPAPASAQAATSALSAGGNKAALSSTNTPAPTYTPVPSTTSTPTDVATDTPVEVAPTPPSWSNTSSKNGSRGSKGTTSTQPSSAKLGDLRISIEASRVDPYGSGVLTPAGGDVFLILSVSVQNAGTARASFNSLLTTVQDQAGAQYRIALDPNAGHGPDVFIEPGVTSRGELVYEIPADAKGLVFVYKPITEPRGLLLPVPVWDPGF